MANAFPIRFPDQLRQHLRALRKRRGLTQAQLGALIGVSQARIAEIEANPGLVNFEQLMKLLSVLGASLTLQEGSVAPAATSAPAAKASRPRSTKATKPQPTAPPGPSMNELVATSAHSVRTPGVEWKAKPLRKGAKGGLTSVLVTRAKPATEEGPPAPPPKKGAAEQHTLPSTTSILDKLRALNPDMDVQPTSKRNFVVRPKKGSW